MFIVKMWLEIQDDMERNGIDMTLCEWWLDYRKHNQSSLFEGTSNILEFTKL